MRPAVLTPETLHDYYEKIKQFDVVFNEHVPNDPIEFASIFLGQDKTGEVFAKGLIWEVDDVGILYLTEICETQALAHFTFWDRKLRGRLNLIREMIKYCFARYGFERIETRVALYAKPILPVVEKIGFKKEGRLRHTSPYKGKWFDTNIYSILKGELDATEGKADRTA